MSVVFATHAVKNAATSRVVCIRIYFTILNVLCRYASKSDVFMYSFGLKDVSFVFVIFYLVIISIVLD